MNDAWQSNRYANRYVPSVDLEQAIRSAIDINRQSIERVRVRYEIEVDPALPGLEYHSPGFALLCDLLRHAEERTPTGGEVTVTACIKEGAIEIEIADGGPALPHHKRWQPIISIQESRAKREMPLQSQSFGTEPESQNEETKLLDLWRRQAMWLGGDCWAEDCPQGGVAWTIRLPAKRSQRRAA